MIRDVLIEIKRGRLYGYRGYRDKHEAKIEEAMTSQLGSLELIFDA